MKDIQYEAAIVDSWEVEAEKLAQIALETFRNLKNDTTSVKESATLDALDIVETSALNIMGQVRTRHDEEKQLHLESNINSVDPLLFDDNVWEAGGFEVENKVPPNLALTTIQAIPLKSYKLKDDKRRDLVVNRDEHRTRYHVGPIYSEDLMNNTMGDRSKNFASRMDSRDLFSFNIGAVTQLSTSVDWLSSRFNAAASLIQQHSQIDEKLLALKTITKQSNGDPSQFKSPSQLASEVAALETEAALRRVTRLSHALIQSTRVKLVYARFVSRLKSLVVNDQSSEKMSSIERESMATRYDNAGNVETDLDTVLIYLEAIDTIKTLWNATTRYVWFTASMR